MNKELTYLETEPLTAEREWVSDGMVVLHASVRVPRPVPSTGGVCRRVRRYYQLQSQAFFRYCQRELLPQAAAEYAAALACSRPLPDFHAELDYHVTYNEGGFWSLYTQSRETGPGGTLLVRRGDTWDLGAGYPVPAAKFFSGAGPLRKALLSAAETETAALLQPRQLLSHRGRLCLLLPHALHCPGLCRHPRVYAALPQGAPPGPGERMIPRR